MVHFLNWDHHIYVLSLNLTWKPLAEGSANERCSKVGSYLFQPLKNNNVLSHYLIFHGLRIKCELRFSYTILPLELWDFVSCGMEITDHPPCEKFHNSTGMTIGNIAISNLSFILGSNWYALIKMDPGYQQIFTTWKTNSLFLNFVLSTACVILNFRNNRKYLCIQRTDFTIIEYISSIFHFIGPIILIHTVGSLFVWRTTW